MITAFCALALVTFLQNLASLLYGLTWLRYIRGYRAGANRYVPPVTVIVPCRGAEPDLGANLAAYLEQDYPDYEVLFVTGGAQDPATHVVEMAIAGPDPRLPDQAPRAGARLILASPPSDEGDKIAKLRCAVGQVRKESAVLAFGDSDGRPGREWLRNLVAPLEDPGAGAATGYRWYVPASGAASLLRSVWNSFIASYFGNHKHNFCWGGSMAVRRETFVAARVEEYWRGSVSDDYQLTRALRQAHLRVVFVPGCLVASRGECNWRELFSWTTRQIVITRVYAPELWVGGLVANSLHSATLALGLVLAVRWPPAAALLALILVPAALKGFLRLRGAEAMLPDSTTELARRRWAYPCLAPLIPLLMLYNFLAAGFTRTIEWRGVRYELRGRNQTRVRAFPHAGIGPMKAAL